MFLENINGEQQLYSGCVNTFDTSDPNEGRCPVVNPDVCPSASEDGTIECTLPSNYVFFFFYVIYLLISKFLSDMFKVTQ